MVNHDDLAEEFTEFRDQLESRRLVEPLMFVGGRYEEDTPVVDVTAVSTSYHETFSYSESYRLEDISQERFEDEIFFHWKEAFKYLESDEI